MTDDDNPDPTGTVVPAGRSPEPTQDRAGIARFAELLMLLQQVQDLDATVPLDDIARARIELAAAGAFGTPAAQRWESMPRAAKAASAKQVHEVLLAALVAGCHIVAAEPLAADPSPRRQHQGDGEPEHNEHTTDANTSHANTGDANTSEGTTS